MCGIFGIFGEKDSARLTYSGLYALQHRGEETTGIASFDGKRVYYRKGKGLVGDVFSEADIKSLKGHIAVGHNRYSTTGSSSAENTQPIMVNHRRTPVVVAHNGNFVNAYELHANLEKRGTVFQTTMDSEIIVHLLARSGKGPLEEQIREVLSEIKGAYSLIIMVGENLVGIRDPWGFRPLSLAKLGDSYILSSETCAFDLVGAEYIRELDPGEGVIINSKGLKSFRAASPCEQSFCIFEYIYFARPDSEINRCNICNVRKCLGKRLAMEHPVKADFVIPIPDSGSYAALGFAQEAGLPFEFGMIRNHYVGRTFIQPSQRLRDFSVRIKLNPIKSVLKGKRIAVIEDSIVRGTTSKLRVKTLREAGTKEIHMRVSCPPIRYPCFYGIDFPSKRELIASKKTVGEIRNFIGLDSLKYLSTEGMLESMSLPKEHFCVACFTGKYPVKPVRRPRKTILE